MSELDATLTAALIDSHATIQTNTIQCDTYSAKNDNGEKYKANRVRSKSLSDIPRAGEESRENKSVFT